MNTENYVHHASMQTQKCEIAENGSEHGPCQWWGPHPCWGEVKQRHCAFHFNETLFLQKRQIVIHSNVVN